MSFAHQSRSTLQTLLRNNCAQRREGATGIQGSHDSDDRADKSSRDRSTRKFARWFPKDEVIGSHLVNTWKDGAAIAKLVKEIGKGFPRFWLACGTQCVHRGRRSPRHRSWIRGVRPLRHAAVMVP